MTGEIFKGPKDTMFKNMEKKHKEYIQNYVIRTKIRLNSNTCAGKEAIERTAKMDILISSLKVE